MEYIDKIKRMLCNELEEYATKSKISMQDLETIHKLTDTVKNLDKIEMLEDNGYSEYYDDRRNSYARGRGRNAKRDSMGRYSRDYEDYSRGDVKEHMLDKLGEMMAEADPKQREVLKECMRAVERA